MSKNFTFKKRKKRSFTYKLKNKTPKNILKLSNSINEELINKNISNQDSIKKSYSPSINKELVTLKSISRENITDCNIEKAFNLKEELEIGIPIKPSKSSKSSKSNNNLKCVNFKTQEAKQFLLKNLSANKHINPNIIIPPIQAQSNCWFNTFFVNFFISDKGRKFFHFLRQLMIEGKQTNGKKIPDNLAQAFALLNYGIDASLTGNKIAYTLNTNSIIHKIYESIPEKYKSKYPYIIDVDNAGNPMLYYNSIINYLHSNSINILFMRNIKNTENLQNDIISQININSNSQKIPHIIVLELFDGYSYNEKPIEIKLENKKLDITYKLDSAVIRDTSKQHFSSTLTCEKKEMAYDGMSFHRIIKLNWREKLNKNIFWEFEGTKDNYGNPLKWNFTKCYQMLFYYRITK